MEDSIFTKIIRGEIPCHKVYEDEKVFAMLDIDPLADGHVLVFPKKQVDLIWDLEDEDYMYLMKISKDLAQKIQAEMKPIRVGMVVEGFGVPHAHIHVFGYEQPLNETIIRHVETDHRQHTTPAHLAEVAARLRGQ